MKITDGSIKVLVVDYGTPQAPLLVSVGYKFQDSPHNTKEFIRVVRNLNESASWHYRDRDVILGGAQYRIAEVYEENTPLREIYPVELVTDEKLMNILLKYCLAMSDLGVPQELRGWRPAVQQPTVQQPAVQQPQPTQEPTVQGQTQQQPQEQPAVQQSPQKESKYTKYFTPAELAKYGDLDSLSEEDLEELEDLYEERHGDELQRSLVKYELPSELSNYNLAYREAVLGKSVLIKDKTAEEVESLKHELGSGAVVEAMIQEVPKPIGRDVGKEGSEDLSSSFKSLGRAFSKVFKGNYNKDYGGEVPAEMEASPIFSGITNRVLLGIKNTYGTFTNFIGEFINMEIGHDVLPVATIQHKNLNIEYRTVKSYDNMTGYYIGFVKEDREYMFPLALFEVTAYMESVGKLLGNITFETAFNSSLEDFCSEINKKGLNISKMRLTSHQVDVINVEYLGYCEENEEIVYLFRKFPVESNLYSMIYADNLGNKLFGARYVLEGSNFEINYLGNKIVVKPTVTPPPMPVPSEVYDFISANYLNVKDPYAGYYKMLDFKTSKDVPNNEYRRIIESYEELLPKTWNAGHVWNTDLIEGPVAGKPVVTPQPVINVTEDVSRPNNEDVVDIFGGQPVGVFEPKVETIEITPEYVEDVGEVSDIHIKEISPAKSETIIADPSPYDTSIFPGNIAQAYTMIMGSLNQAELGKFKTEFIHLIDKYKN